MFELFAAILLVLLLAIAGALIYRLRALTEEARALKSELAEIRRGQRSEATRASATSHRAAPVARPDPPRPPAPPAAVAAAVAAAPAKPRHDVAERAVIDTPAPSMPNLGARRAASMATGGTQGQLPLPPDPGGGLPPLPLDVLIRALQFPETAEDTEGFRALRRALRDHRAGQLIQAAQDVLTLLSQEGLYMDDLPPDRARPELWRRFAQGERGGAVAALGGIRDRAALAMAGGRMRKDPVFRDATHHFLRRFDRMLADLEPLADDAQIAGLADTRTARAFMLLGRVMGIFD